MRFSFTLGKLTLDICDSPLHIDGVKKAQSGLVIISTSLYAKHLMGIRMELGREHGRNWQRRSRDFSAY
jgi:hypothetical protein